MKTICAENAWAGKLIPGYLSYFIPARIVKAR